MQARDHYGVEIKPGCTIAYPVRRGSSLTVKHLSVSRVIESPDGPWITGLNDRGRRVNVRNLSHTFVKT